MYLEARTLQRFVCFSSSFMFGVHSCHCIHARHPPMEKDSQAKMPDLIVVFIMVSFSFLSVVQASRMSMGG